MFYIKSLSYSKIYLFIKADNLSNSLFKKSCYTVLFPKSLLFSKSRFVFFSTKIDPFTTLNEEDWYFKLQLKIQGWNAKIDKENQKLRSLLDPKNLLNSASDFLNLDFTDKSFEDIQLIHEKSIINYKIDNKLLGEKSLGDGTRFKLLFDNLPEDLRNWLYHLVLENIFYQNINRFDKYSIKLVLYLSPLVQAIHTILSRSDVPFTKHYKKKKESYLINRYKEITDLLTLEKDIKERMRLQREKDKIRKKIKAKGCQKDIRYIRDILVQLIISLDKAGFPLEKKTIFKYQNNKRVVKTHHVINITEKEWFLVLHQLAWLGKKPMLCKPLDWSFKKNKLIGGGYLLTEDVNLGIYQHNNKEVDIEFEYDIKYMEKINKLQSMGLTIQDNHWLNNIINIWLTYLFKKLKVVLTIIKNEKKMYENVDCDTYSKMTSKVYYYHLLEYDKNVQEVNIFLMQLYQLKTLELVFKKKKAPFTIYCPIHIDRIGRMYQHGLLNIVNSKFLRCILQPEKDIATEKDIDILSTWNKSSRVSVLKSTDYHRLRFLVFASKTKKAKVVFMDATSSMLQIIAFLFGYKKLAIYTNLASESRQDAILWLANCWKDDITDGDSFEIVLKILNDRKTMKLIIMLLLYGSSVYGLQRKLSDANRKNIDFLQDKDYYSRYNDALGYVISKVRNSFLDLFSLNNVKKGYSFSRIVIKWQGNKSKYTIFNTKNKRFDITEVWLNKWHITQKELDNKVESLKGKEKVGKETYQKKYYITFSLNSDKIDTRKLKRTILTGLIHSIDAMLAVELRIKMFSLYKIRVYSIHDCFGCDSRFASKMSKVYKECLNDFVFNKNLSDFIEIYIKDKKGNEILHPIIAELEKNITKRKETDDWLDILKSQSDYCLLLE